MNTWMEYHLNPVGDFRWHACLLVSIATQQGLLILTHRLFFDRCTLSLVLVPREITTAATFIHALTS